MLKEKKILITGGTRGIGRAIAQTFAAQGADVMILGTSEEKAQETLALLEHTAKDPNQKFAYKLVNVGQHMQVLSALEEIEKTWGVLDVVVNNAGITRDNLLMRMTEKEWNDVLDINLKSIYSVCHFVIKSMLKARKGKIINVSSVIGLTGNPGQVNYSASKFGVIGFTRSLAIEVAKRGVCVNCIAPGFIETDMTAGLTDAQKDEILRKIPMQKLGTTHDIAQAALFLASSMSDYVTGQVITVDGGMLA
jgi:3-oxoacyl-[acyl-carrier protein] reductase